ACWKLLCRLRILPADPYEVCLTFMEHHLFRTAKDAISQIVHPNSEEDSRFRARLCKWGGMALAAVSGGGVTAAGIYNITHEEYRMAEECLTSFVIIDGPLLALCAYGTVYYRRYAEQLAGVFSEATAPENDTPDSAPDRSYDITFSPHAHPGPVA